MKNELNSLLNRVDTRLAACAAAAVATAAIAPSSQADIVYSGTVNLNIASSTNGLYLNVVTGANNVVGMGGGTTVPGWDINPWNATGFGLFSNSNQTGGSYVVTAANFGANLAPGAVISAASMFGSGSSTNNAQWNLNSSNNLVGFRFLNEATGITNYGWFRVSFSTTTSSQPRTLVEFAYENTGSSIMAGQTAIPEPTTFALLGVMAAGAFGVRVWRSRKAA